MKRRELGVNYERKLVKRFVMASLCVGLAFSAFSGITAVSNNVALADGTETRAATTINTEDFMYTAADATYTTLMSGTTEQKGLRISSDKAYTAKMKTVFTGNATFNFRFAETAATAIYGDFQFRITDATDDSNYFDIRYRANKTSATVQNDNRTVPYVYWSNQMRTGHVADSLTYNAIRSVQKDGFAPNFLNYGKYGTRMGKLSLTWSDDVLTITANDGYHATAKDIVIAKFDGTYDKDATSVGFVNRGNWGLPKMNFADGYTITVSSNFTKSGVEDHGSDVFFQPRNTLPASSVGMSSSDNAAYLSSNASILLSFVNVAVLKS